MYKKCNMHTVHSRYNDINEDPLDITMDPKIVIIKTRLAMQVYRVSSIVHNSGIVRLRISKS